MRPIIGRGRALCLGLLILAVGCKTPPVPAEAERARALEEEIWRTGGVLFAKSEYELYSRQLTDLRARLASEKAKWGWFRNYGDEKTALRDLIAEGEGLLEKIRTLKTGQTSVFADAAEKLGQGIERLKWMTQFFNESDDIRKNIAQAEIKLVEARIRVEKEQFGEGLSVVAEGWGFVSNAQAAAASLLRRYLDSGRLTQWRSWAEETVAESKATGAVAIVVSKIERRLTVYRRGEVAAVFEIGLGKYGLSDKLYSGDEATPEGRYRIIRKFPKSAFHKALLIDYPNDEDRLEFDEARRRGLVPAAADIGGAIEIHGGGKDNLTRGCVGLENKDMDEVYRWVEPGTPVTIVGALAVENTILADIKKFAKHD